MLGSSLFGIFVFVLGEAVYHEKMLEKTKCMTVRSMFVNDSVECKMLEKGKAGPKYPCYRILVVYIIPQSSAATNSPKAIQIQEKTTQAPRESIKSHNIFIINSTNNTKFFGLHTVPPSDKMKKKSEELVSKIIAAKHFDLPQERISNLVNLYDNHYIWSQARENKAYYLIFTKIDSLS